MTNQDHLLIKKVRLFSAKARIRRVYKRPSTAIQPPLHRLPRPDRPPETGSNPNRPRRLRFWSRWVPPASRSRPNPSCPATQSMRACYARDPLPNPPAATRIYSSTRALRRVRAFFVVSESVPGQVGGLFAGLSCGMWASWRPIALLCRNAGARALGTLCPACRGSVASTTSCR